MNGNGQPQPIQVQPGMHVQPGPTTLLVQRHPTGSIVLHFEHATGSTVIVGDPSWIRQMIQQLQNAVGALIVPDVQIPPQ